jgi:hypothetical protein
MSNLSPVTQTIQLLGASSSVVIPINACRWTVTVLTGTATIGAATGLPAGFSDSDEGRLLATITVTTAASSTAYVRYSI